MTSDLSALRGLHLPTGGGNILQSEVLAAVAIGFALALVVGAVRFLYLRMQTSVRRDALRELAHIRSLHSAERRAAQARLLRRVVRTLGGDAAASAHGATWAAVLDRTFATRFFSEGDGRTLVEELYRRSDMNDQAHIDTELGRLLARLKA